MRYTGKHKQLRKVSELKKKKPAETVPNLPCSIIGKMREIKNLSQCQGTGSVGFLLCLNLLSTLSIWFILTSISYLMNRTWFCYCQLGQIDWQSFQGFYILINLQSTYSPNYCKKSIIQSLTIIFDLSISPSNCDYFAPCRAPL